jgi:hypothetical protein
MLGTVSACIIFRYLLKLPHFPEQGYLEFNAGDAMTVQTTTQKMFIKVTAFLSLSFLVACGMTVDGHAWLSDQIESRGEYNTAHTTSHRAKKSAAHPEANELTSGCMQEPSEELLNCVLHGDKHCQQFDDNDDNEVNVLDVFSSACKSSSGSIGDMKFKGSSARRDDDACDFFDSGLCGLPQNSISLATDGSVFYHASENIGGFQFALEEGSLIHASGGAAEAADFMVTYSDIMLLAFSLTSNNAPAGCGKLIELETEGNVGELTDIVVASIVGEDIPFQYYTDDGMTDDEVCDCDGNVEDCAGECGGDALEDECGVCHGDGSSCNTELSVPLGAGLNWISVNVENDGNDINDVLAGINAVDYDFIKSTSASSQYFQGSGWIGGLAKLAPGKGYKLSLANADTLVFSGTPVVPSATPIELGAGWNWIGFTPQTSMPINEALASIEAVDYDFIKGPNGSAQYFEGSGWMGGLGQLEPGKGYMLRVANAGTLIFPDDQSER